MTSIRLAVATPKVPNFVRIPALGDKGTIPISALTDAELTELGQWWTENLIQRAKDMRATEAAE